MAVCALCLNDKELAESHVFPEFLYKVMYDSKHQFNVISTDSEKPVRKRRKGIYEELLCDGCDGGVIGVYESHAANVLFHDRSLEYEEFPRGILVHGLDYSKFKLFQLSLLWRASIATRPEINRIDLRHHGDRIRQMLLSGDPGDVYDYGCAMFFLPDQPEEMVGCIYQPELLTRKVQGHRCYRAIFCGLFWIYFVSSHMGTYLHPEVFLTKDGVLPLINSGTKGWNFIISFARDLTKNRGLLLE